MRNFFSLLLLLLFVSCNSKGPYTGSPLITVSIAPFKFFVEEIAGNDFEVNVMVGDGDDPHIYEPFPDQINKLRLSVGYISNGYLGFEMVWLERFYEVNKTMKRLNLGDNIEVIHAHSHDGHHVEGADPHYWESPQCALIIASSVKEFLCDLNPSQKEIYEMNYKKLVSEIEELDRKALKLFSESYDKSFLIFHPTFAYMARDYDLEEISLEFEGKEPSPRRMKELVDLAKKDGFKTVFVQREFDTKIARAIAKEIGAEIKIINPLSEDWLNTTTDIIVAIHESFSKSANNL